MIIFIPLKQINPIFQDLDVTIFNDDAHLSFALTYEMVEFSRDATSGIFCNTAETIDIARAQAKERCFESTPDVWAVHFEGHILCNSIT